MRRLWLFLQSVDQVTSTEKYEAKIQELLGAMPKKNVTVRPDEWSLQWVDQNAQLMKYGTSYVNNNYNKTQYDNLYHFYTNNKNGRPRDAKPIEYKQKLENLKKSLLEPKKDEEELICENIDKQYEFLVSKSSEIRKIWSDAIKDFRTVQQQKDSRRSSRTSLLVSSSNSPVYQQQVDKRPAVLNSVSFEDSKVEDSISPIFRNSPTHDNVFEFSYESPGLRKTQMDLNECKVPQKPQIPKRKLPGKNGRFLKKFKREEVKQLRYNLEEIDQGLDEKLSISMNDTQSEHLNQSQFNPFDQNADCMSQYSSKSSFYNIQKLRSKQSNDTASMRISPIYKTSQFKQFAFDDRASQLSPPVRKQNTNIKIDEPYQVILHEESPPSNLSTKAFDTSVRSVKSKLSPTEKVSLDNFYKTLSMGDKSVRKAFLQETVKSSRQLPNEVDPQFFQKRCLEEEGPGDLRRWSIQKLKTETNVLASELESPAKIEEKYYQHSSYQIQTVKKPTKVKEPNKNIMKTATKIFKNLQDISIQKMRSSDKKKNQGAKKQQLSRGQISNFKLNIESLYNDIDQQNTDSQSPPSQQQRNRAVNSSSYSTVSPDIKSSSNSSIDKSRKHRPELQQYHFDGPDSIKKALQQDIDSSPQHGNLTQREMGSGSSKIISASPNQDREIHYPYGGPSQFEHNYRASIPTHNRNPKFNLKLDCLKSNPGNGGFKLELHKTDRGREDSSETPEREHHNIPPFKGLIDDSPRPSQSGSEHLIMAKNQFSYAAKQREESRRESQPYVLFDRDYHHEEQKVNRQPVKYKNDPIDRAVQKYGDREQVYFVSQNQQERIQHIKSKKMKVNPKYQSNEKNKI